MTNKIQADCPECGEGRTRVVCTRRDNIGVFIRRRHCLTCDHRWYTMQYPEVSIKNREVKWVGKNGRNAKFIQSA